MAVVGRVTNQGDLELTGNINTRLPLVQDGLVAHYPHDGNGNKYFPTNIRYLRSWKNGSTVNANNHWVEIEVFDYAGNNLAAGLIPTTSSGTLTNPSGSTDGVLNSYTTQPIGALGYLEIDLLDVYDVKEINIIDFYTDGRTYHEPKLEVSDDGVRWYTIYDHAVEGEYVATEGGKLHNFSNLGTTVVPMLDIDTIYTDDYSAFSIATTNLIPDADLSNGLQHPYFSTSSGGTLEIIKDPTGKNVLKQYNPNTAQETYTNSIIVGLAPVTVGDKFRFTASVRTEELSSSVELYIFGIVDGGSYNELSNTVRVVSREEGWVKLEVEHEITDILSDNVSVRLDNNNQGNIYWKDIQLEQNTYSTEFINGSKLLSKLDYDKNTIDPNVGSFVVKFTHNNEIFDDVLYNDVLDFKGAFNNKFLILRQYASDNTPTRVYLRDGNIWRSIDISDDIIVDGLNTIIWTWEVGVGYQMYVNNVLATKSTSYTLGDKWADTDRYQFAPPWEVHSHSIYNRQLTVDEIALLSKGTHNINALGLNTSGIETEPFLGGVHFPFSYDGSDYFKTVHSTKDIGAIFDQEHGMYIGNATTNLYTDGDFALQTFHPFRNTSSLITFPNDVVGPNGENVIRIDANGSSDWHGREITISDATVYTYSAWLYMSEDCDSTNYRIRPGTGFLSTGNAKYDITRRGTWQRVHYTDTSNATITKLLLYQLDNMTTGYVLATGIQLEERDFTTPFTPVSSQQGNMHIPYDVIDCKQDFTIYGWFRPKEISNGFVPVLTRNRPDANDTGNRILIMSNSANDTFRTWTSSGGSAESTQSQVNSLIRPDEWNFFAFRRSGADLILSLGNNTDGIFHSTNGVGDASSLDVDEVDQVWQVGEYNNAESKAYHKDYVFDQATYTDEQIEMIFKRKMKSDINGLKLIGNINTNKTL